MEEPKQTTSTKQTGSTRQTASNANKTKDASGHPTNSHDVEIAKIEAQLEKTRLEIAERFGGVESERKDDFKRFEKSMDTARSVLTAGMVLAGYVFTVTANNDFRKHKIEFGRDE